MIGLTYSEALRALIDKLEFNTLERDFGAALKSRPRVQNSFDYRAVLRTDFPAWLNSLKQQVEFSFDLETTGLDSFTASIVGLSFCWDNHQAWYLPVGHTALGDTQMSWAEVREALAPLLENDAIKKIGQNLKFDSQMLAQHGVNFRGITFDTMIAAYLLNPDRRSFTLGNLAQDYLGLAVSEYSDVTANVESFADVALKQATDYAAEDAHVAWLLRNHFVPMISEAELERVLYEIEVPLISVLSLMERRGILLDTELLRSISGEYQGRLEILQGQLYEIAGSEFNINSPKQLSEILFDRLNLPTKGLKRTKTGISTDSSVLDQLADFHPLPKKILEFRMLHKLKSTYIDALPAQVSSVTGRLHSRFNQTGTATGRLSSSDPNLQNIPIQTAEGRRIREAFIAKPGYTLISADYSQIELRLLAHLSGDTRAVSGI